MSITANIEGGLVISDPIILTTANLTDVYSAIYKDEIVVSVSLVNEGSNVASVTLNRNDGSSDMAIWHGSLAAHSTHIITQIRMRLYTNEKLTAITDQAGDITITPIIIRVGTYEAHNRSDPAGR